MKFKEENKIDYLFFVLFGWTKIDYRKHKNMIKIWQKELSFYEKYRVFEFHLFEWHWYF